MFDVGQPLEHPYHRTKFESERLVRETAKVPWRIYRPPIVVGDSQTGRIEKVDGPYYFFPILKRAGHLIPDWLPLVGPELGSTNLVPVDYVASALDHIAHQPGLDGQAFHLTDTDSSRVVDVVNTFAKYASAPQFALSVDPGPFGALPRGAANALMALPRRALGGGPACISAPAHSSFIHLLGPAPQEPTSSVNRLQSSIDPEKQRC